MTGVGWRPLGDKIIVKKLGNEESDVTASGLFVVSHEKNDKTKRAEVVSVGEGRYQNGVRIPISVAVGDIIIYNGMYGTDIGAFLKADENEYMILHEEDIIGVVN